MIRRVVFNQKGGVGKSSIAVNLAAISAARGHRTLLIDLDPQCNSTQYLLGHKANGTSTHPILEPNIQRYFGDVLESGNKGLMGSIGGLLKSRKAQLADSIHPTPLPRLSVIPASPDLGSLEHALQSKHKIFKLRDALGDLSGQFDHVWIDTPPAYNFYTLSALIAADKVLIPFDCDVFSKRALETLLENIAETQADHNDRLTVEGVVVNQFQSRATLPRQMVQSLQDDGVPVFKSHLPSSVIMKESHQANQPLVQLAPDHKLTQAFMALADELKL